MNSRRDRNVDDVRPFQCLTCPKGCVCLRWRRPLLLHFSQEDVGAALDCLGDVLHRPSCPFSLGAGSFCATHAGDGHYYLVCKEKVVLRLSPEDARNLYGELASVRVREDKNRV